MTRHATPSSAVMVTRPPELSSWPCGYNIALGSSNNRGSLTALHLTFCHYPYALCPFHTSVSFSRNWNSFRVL
jgi:hypothetical protein